jgi:glucosylceramidase
VTEVSGGANVTVNENTTYQTWIGFGGSFNEAGWDALAVLSATERDRAIRLLFDVTDGCGFTFGRIPIGASDYALDRYTLNDTPDDYEMTNFSIARDQQNLIPYVQAALAVKSDIRFWASPWSPPAWMKENNDLNGIVNGVENGNMRSDPAVLDAHALYLAMWVEAYEGVGIDIEAVMPQNEPGYATRYPSCLWSANLLRDHIRDHLGPLFASRNVPAEIWLGALSNSTSTAHVNAVMGDAGAAQYIHGIGCQWNLSGSVGGWASSYGLPIMQTEHKCGNYPWETFNPDMPPNDHAYGVESWGLLKEWIQAGVHIYSAWNMVLDTQGHNLDYERPWPQNALLTVDRNSNTLNVTPAYYVFRHLAQYVEPGAVRLGVSGGDALAFRNPDGSIVTVLYNSGGTSETTLAVGGTTLQFSVPGDGWATVNWQG